MLTVSDELYAGTAVASGGGGSAPVIEELNVTPSTTAQIITAPEGTDGYSPVNVSAVTSSIDANIQAGNIKSGVSILGTTGTLEGVSTITATNNSSSAVTSGDKVWVEPISQNYTFTSTSGENAITTSPFRFTSTGTSGSLNALISNNTTSIGSSSVEVQIKYKINRAPENYLFLASIFGKDSQGLDYQNGSYNGMTYRITTNNTAIWTISNWDQYGASNISSKVGNWIWDKFTLTASGSDTIFLTQNSTDGINWTNGSSFTSSFNLFANLFENLVRFGINTTIGSEFTYELDLDETYVKVDGQIVWKAQTGGGYEIKDFSSVTSSFFTGTARENIAINASGSVTVGFNKSKFGATIDNFLGNVDSNGKMLAPQTMDLVFTGVTSFEAAFPNVYTGKYMFYGNESINNVSFPDIVNIADINILSNAFARSHIKSLIFDKLETVSGISVLNDACSYSYIESVSFPKLTTISNGFQNFCSNTYGQTLNISFPKLKTITGSQANIFGRAFSNSKVVSVEFPELETVSVTQNSSCSNVFVACPNLTSLSLPKLKSASYMQYFCSYNNNLTSISLPNLEEITQVFGFEGFFRSTGITTFTFTKLKSIKSSLSQAFRDCISLTDLYFPALDTFGGYNQIGVNMLQGCSNVTVHFPSNLQSVIGSWSDVTAGFGGTNTTILFDLPATE